jgi:hypothetical protein
VLLQSASSSHLLRASISTLAEKLRPYGFVRIHRSVLVNASCVQELQPWTTGEYLLRTRGGKEYTVSRTYKGSLGSLALLRLSLNFLPPASGRRFCPGRRPTLRANVASGRNLTRRVGVFGLFFSASFVLAFALPYNLKF